MRLKKLFVESLQLESFEPMPQNGEAGTVLGYDQSPGTQAPNKTCFTCSATCVGQPSCVVNTCRNCENEAGGPA